MRRFFALLFIMLAMGIMMFVKPLGAFRPFKIMSLTSTKTKTNHN